MWLLQADSAATRLGIVVCMTWVVVQLTEFCFHLACSIARMFIILTRKMTFSDMEVIKNEHVDGSTRWEQNVMVIR